MKKIFIFITLLLSVISFSFARKSFLPTVYIESDDYYCAYFDEIDAGDVEGYAVCFVDVCQFESLIVFPEEEDAMDFINTFVKLYNAGDKQQLENWLTDQELNNVKDIENTFITFMGNQYYVIQKKLVL